MNDWAMQIGRFGVLWNILTSVTLNQAPCRAQIFSFIGIKRKTKTWEHFVATTMICSASIGVAIIFPNVISAFSFVGGTGAVFLVIIFPMLIYVK